LYQSYIASLYQSYIAKVAQEYHIADSGEDGHEARLACSVNGNSGMIFLYQLMFWLRYPDE
jgi:hypothetical protein